MTAEPSNAQRRKNLACWLPFALIAVALHAALWFFVPAGRATVAGREQPIRVTFSYVRVPGGDGEAWRDDIRALWSPVLFSVPTPMGFSAPLLTDSAGLGPPENPATATPLLASRGNYVPPADGPGPHDQLGMSVSSLTVRAVAAPAFLPRKPSTNVLLHIMWTDQHGSPRYQSVDVGNSAPWVDKKPWDAQALLELDGQGAVLHVFLEKPTSLKDRNAALIRVLSALRMDSDSMARSGRVTVRSEGVAVAPEETPAP